MRYNGADGHPIREEIVEKQTHAIVTRNSYGARCLNTPSVFIADIDYPENPISCALVVTGIFIGVAAGGAVARMALFNEWSAAIAFGVFMATTVLFPWLVHTLREVSINLRGGRDQIALAQIDHFVEKNPGWHLRVYRSPNGFRLIALHQLFDARSEEVESAFRALGVDPIYVVMCQKQNCFRARLSAKPWRMDFTPDCNLSRSVWPVAEELTEQRNRWIEQYEEAAANFAACQFIKSLGAELRVDPTASSVCEFHDSQCKSDLDLPLA